MLRIVNRFTPYFTKFDKKKFTRKRLPWYVAGVLILLIGGIKGFMITFFLFLSFFLGWTLKGMYQAFHDWRLTQRLNRVHYAAAEFEQIKRENSMLRQAIDAYKDHAKKSRGGAGPGTAQAPPAQSPRFDEQTMRDLILQMSEGK